MLFGLLCDQQRCPVAGEVFEGNVDDPGPLDCITALRATTLHKLVETAGLQRSLFDERNLVEITNPVFPNE